MGQHKHNPNVDLAKEGKLPPKPQKMSKREMERLIQGYIRKNTMLGKLEQAIIGNDPRY